MYRNAVQGDAKLKVTRTNHDPPQLHGRVESI